MKMDDFVPGLKYQRGNQIDLWYFIRYNEKGFPVFEHLGQIEVLYSDSNAESFVEFKEPKKGSVRLYIRSDGVNTWGACVIQRTALAKTIAVIQVPWVEGEGL